MNGVFLHVRQGFERDAAEELIGKIENLSVTPTKKIHAEENTGYVLATLTSTPDAESRRNLNFKSLIFARQLLWVVSSLELPSSGDRVTPLLDQIISKAVPASNANAFSSLSLETPDTDQAKELSRFCRSLERPLENALNKARLLPKGKGAAHLPRVHILMLSSTQALIAISDVENSSAWPMGIPRLKFPSEAPSRSTLKLEEAFHVFLGREGMESALRPEMTAVDLGACPGGWTYQFVKRNIKTIAIDNGEISENLMNTGLVTHLKEDAFRFRPHQQIDWLVCDVVEQPSRISNLISSWLVSGQCRFAIFNLKLPMKRRYEEVYNCLKILEDTCTSRGLRLTLQAKQLYHDRKEVTVFAASRLIS